MFAPKLFTCLKDYNKDQFVADCIAGFVVGVVAIPLAIAFAIASGVSPDKGLFTAVGSAYASLATQFITAIIQVAIAQQIFKFDINWKYIFTLLFFATGVIVLNFISYSINWDWRIGLIIAGLASVLWAFVLNLLSVGGFIRLLKNE